MSFQTQVNIDKAKAVAGDPYSLNARATTARKAGEDITISKFVWENAAGTVTHSGTGAPIGLAIRENSGIGMQFKAESNMTIPKGFNVPIEMKGERWVTATTSATKGQAVYANTRNGNLVTDDPGEDVTDCVETSWRVIEAGTAGNLIAISTWRD